MSIERENGKYGILVLEDRRCEDHSNYCKPLQYRVSKEKVERFWGRENNFPRKRGNGNGEHTQ